MSDYEMHRRLQYLKGNKEILEIMLNGAIKLWYVPATRKCLDEVNKEIKELQMQLTFGKLPK